jgi:hypothetical protein
VPPSRSTARCRAPGRAPNPLAETDRARVLADREYRGLWLALTLSPAGDQLAQAALAVLVFTTTGSAVATAGTYADGQHDCTHYVRA